MNKKKDKNIVFLSIIVIITLTMFLMSFDSLLQIKLNNITYFVILSIVIFLIFLSNNFILLNCTSLFTIFYIFFIGIGPIILTNKNYNYFFNAKIVILISLILFFIGNITMLIFSVHMSNKKYLYNCETKYLIKKRKKLAVWILIVSIVFWIKFIYKNINILFNDMENGRVLAMQGNGATIYFVYLSMLAVWILFDGYINYKNIKRKSITLIILFTTFMLFTLGFRSRIAELFLVMIIIYNNKYRLPLRKLINFGLIGVLSILGLYYIRMIISGENSVTLKYLLENIMEVNNINLSYIFRRFPNYVEYQNGYTYIINFLMLKPGPDIDFTLWLKEAQNIKFNGAGVTPTIIGEFYINFGYVGIYIGMFIIGLLCKVVDKTTKKSRSNIVNSIITLYVCRAITGGITNNLILFLWFIIIYFIIEKILLKIKVKI